MRRDTKYVKETIRITVEQNLLLRWVSEADPPALFGELKDAVTKGETLRLEHDYCRKRPRYKPLTLGSSPARSL